MDRSQLITELENAIREHVADGAGFSLQKHLDSREPLPVDSMALFDIGMYVEDQFGLRLEDAQIVKMRDANLLLDTVAGHLASKAPGG